MSERSRIGKQHILACLMGLNTDLNKIKTHVEYLENDLEFIRKLITEKDWLLRTPRKAKQPGVRSADE